ncbi:hypothetical protein J7394_07895 [Ruegeria sp. R13_0]|uniref:hypothetical protein n=1 Tax=Ruegeria sp. R13_0 TaxID=2821099 RepID=UPI001ADD205D|nr:hypothetical protein [Ruegeria sp. R13_0]MBO9434121.1 hypothetical protein [Ruegeria sp. R13_0]
MSSEHLEILKSLLPVLVALLTLTGGGIVYNWQKSIDRKNQILQERRTLYRNFMGKVQQLLLDKQMDKADKAVEHFLEFKLLIAELLVTAPDKVIAPLKSTDAAMKNLMRVTFTSNSGTPFDDDDTASAERDFFDAYEKTLIEMRRDSFGDTEVTDKFAKALVDAMSASLIIGKR